MTILYIDIKEFVSTDSLILTYCFINDCEIKSERLVTKDNCIEFLDDFLLEDTLVLTLSNRIELVRYIPKLRDFQINNLCDYLNLPQMDIYSIFTQLYGVSDTLSHTSMLEIIIKSEVSYQLMKDNSLTLILDYHSIQDESVQLSYCLVSFSDDLHKILSNTIVLDVSLECGMANVSKAFKDIRYNLAKSGYGLRGINLMFFSQYEFGKHSLLLSQYFEAIQHKCFIIQEVLSGLKYISITSYKSFSRFLSNRFKDLERKNADNIASVLIESYKKLGLMYSLGEFRITNTDLRKDFSSDRIEISSRVHCTYGIILDCEGTVTGGCTQVGGIIFCRKSNYLVKLETFVFDNLDIVESFKQVFESYERQIQRYIPNKGIDVLVYGANDEKMIKASFSGKQGKMMKRKIERLFHFTDCRSYVDDFIDMSEVKVDNHKLPSIAKALGVLTVEPRHNALNDSKTLFNVLAQILLKTEEFVI